LMDRTQNLGFYHQISGEKSIPGLDFYPL